MHARQHGEGLPASTGSRGACLRCGLFDRHAHTALRGSARGRRNRANATGPGFGRFKRRACRAPVQGEQS
ncbi:hypothetical protein A8E97_22300 [Burkholderia cenocepacia]|nr:hypothetical protein A8E88_08575 [Burkholderia cenocepacia]ONV92924.1 hypothetical protein A8E89_12845 [Burkholderia cenocepacia]ONW03582.1 hypothetical protein A8E94_34110 [Burkholderia cenocepacia]ONW31004.1 hypothetical protein A8E93_30055 [Burkholderia cenocepacia]ONW34542.1 hypothetical protein A8E99_29690 [Burkholderia cenocepacia]